MTAVIDLLYSHLKWNSCLLDLLLVLATARRQDCCDCTVMSNENLCCAAKAEFNTSTITVVLLSCSQDHADSAIGSSRFPSPCPAIYGRYILIDIRIDIAVSFTVYVHVSLVEAGPAWQVPRSQSHSDPSFHCINKVSLHQQRQTRLKCESIAPHMPLSL